MELVNKLRGSSGDVLETPEIKWDLITRFISGGVEW